MRCFWILILSTSPTLALAEDCRISLGVDRNPPAEVKLQMEVRGLSDFQLIDRKDCKDTTSWFAISKKYPANAPRPPGVEHWLILDLKSRVVDFIPAPG